MTRLLEEAVAQAQRLSDSEQDAIARLLLDEIESDRQWDELLGGSSEQFSKLADKAWAEHEAGRSEPLDPDTL